MAAEELNFIQSWSTRRIAERYGITSRRVQQSLQHWVGRAMTLGYLQAIPTEPVLANAPRTTLRPAFAIPETRPFNPIPATVSGGMAAHSA
jgi:hypothetical protein